MKKAPNVLNPATPALLDEVFISLNTKMLTKLSWLDNAFNKAQTLSRMDDKNRIIKYPAIYTGKDKEYASMLPHEGYGNFSFWRAEDYEMDWIDNQLQVIEANVGLIFWMNLNNVLDGTERRNLESVKAEILSFLISTKILRARFNYSGISEENDKIYKEYSIKEIDQQYLMHPFAGLRFNGRVRYERLCKNQ